MWFRIHADLIFSLAPLHGAPLAVYLTLMSFMDDANQTTASMRTIARRAGYSMRTAGIAIEKLKELGFVRAEERMTDGRIRRTVWPCMTIGAQAPHTTPRGGWVCAVGADTQTKLCATDDGEAPEAPSQAPAGSD